MLRSDGEYTFRTLRGPTLDDMSQVKSPYPGFVWGLYGVLREACVEFLTTAHTNRINYVIYAKFPQLPGFLYMR